MYCVNCGKEIDNNAVVCPYCGVATQKMQNAVPEKSVNGLGIAGFVVSLLSLWLGLYFCVVSVVGLVLSAVAMALRQKYTLNGLAIAGFVISIASLVVWGIIWILVGTAMMSL